MASDLLGQWTSIKSERDAHKNARPERESRDFAGWWDKDTALSLKISEWGKQWTGHCVENTDEFAGWLRDAIAIISLKTQEYRNVLGLVVSESQDMIWAARKSDEFGIAGRPALPPNEVTLLQAASFYDGILVAISNQLYREHRQHEQRHLASLANPNSGISRFLNGPPPGTGNHATKGSNLQAEQTNEDGPIPPKSFIYKGKLTDVIQPLPWKLLDLLWRERRIKVEATEQKIWGNESDTDQRLKSAIKKANRALDAAGCPLSIKKSGDWLTLE